MLRQLMIVTIVTLAGSAPGVGRAPLHAQGPESEAATVANDYGDEASWLCRPGRDDACAVDLTTTRVAADGSLSVEEWVGDESSPVDCFYVYPTVSGDPAGNSDMIAGPGETGVVRSQLARFGSVCRLYAPLYRQITLTALRDQLSGGSMTSDRELGYTDVVDAWDHYLEHDNQGRGVVLIGHSQGAGVLIGLIREEIDGQPVQERIVSAMILGSSVAVPPGEDVGGAFQHMPLCRSADQIGCVITYATFRSTMPPPETSFFGRARSGFVAGCTNPAALGGGSGEMWAYFGTSGGWGATAEWTDSGEEIDTPFVSVPGLLTGECVERDGFSYLEVTVHGDPDDARTDDIPGDIVIADQVSAAWGLHLIDVGVAMGDLVRLVDSQTKAYLKKLR